MLWGKCYVIKNFCFFFFGNSWQFSVLKQCSCRFMRYSPSKMGLCCVSLALFWEPRRGLVAPAACCTLSCGYLICTSLGRSKMEKCIHFPGALLPMCFTWLRLGTVDSPLGPNNSLVFHFWPSFSPLSVLSRTDLTSSPAPRLAVSPPASLTPAAALLTVWPSVYLAPWRLSSQVGITSWVWKASSFWM